MLPFGWELLHGLYPKVLVRRDSGRTGFGGPVGISSSGNYVLPYNWYCRTSLNVRYEQSLRLPFS